MNVSQLKAFCRRFPGASETLYAEPWNFLVYAVGGRKFAYFKSTLHEPADRNPRPQSPTSWDEKHLTWCRNNSRPGH